MFNQPVTFYNEMIVLVGEDWRTVNVYSILTVDSVSHKILRDKLISYRLDKWTAESTWSEDFFFNFF